MNSTGRDFTFYTHPHNNYSRIDAFFLHHHTLPRVHKVSIGHMLIFDHAPVLLQINLEALKGQLWHWSLNKSLLQKPIIRADVQVELTNFFLLNNVSTCTPMTLWEVH